MLEMQIMVLDPDFTGIAHLSSADLTTFAEYVHTQPLCSCGSFHRLKETGYLSLSEATSLHVLPG